MALTLRQIPDEKIMERLRQLTGQTTAAKAIVQAAVTCLQTHDDLEAARLKIKELESTIDTYQQTFQRLAPLYKEVVSLAERVCDHEQ